MNSTTRKSRKASNLEALLEDTPISSYWIGFLLADGHFYQTRLKLHLAAKDASHVKRFGKFIGYRGNAKNKAAISAMNPTVVRQLRERFNITNRKTYEPASLFGWASTHDLVMSRIIGFIDGDGCINRQTGRRDCCIRIKCHASWKRNLQKISDYVAGKAGARSVTVGINKCGYAQIAICHWKVVKYLKREAIRLQLPVLCRKWNRIDLNRVGKTEQTGINDSIVVNLWTSGMRQVDICERTGLCKVTVWKILKRYKKALI